MEHVESKFVVDNSDKEEYIKEILRMSDEQYKKFLEKAKNTKKED